MCPDVPIKGGTTFASWGNDDGPPVPAPMPRSPRPRVHARWALGGIGAIVAAAASILALGGANRASMVSPGALASAINLRASDLPGFQVAAPGRTIKAGRQGKSEFSRCFGVALGAGISTVDSPTFVVGSGAQTMTVYSSVDVLASPSAVTGLLAALNGTRTQRVRSCLNQELNRAPRTTTGSRTDAGTLSHLRVESLPFSEPRANGTASLRVTGTFRQRGVTLHIYDDLYLLGVGRAFIELSANTFGHATPLSDVQRLVSHLVASAVANQH